LKNVFLAVLGAAALGLGAVVAVDHTVGTSQPVRPASLVASTATTSPRDALLGASMDPAHIAGMIATELGVTPDALKADIRKGETLDQIAGIGIDAEGLARAADAGPLDAAVPTCPDWDVETLLRHIGSVHRCAAAIVRERRVDRPQRGLDGPSERGALLDWYRAGYRVLM